MLRIIEAVPVVTGVLYFPVLLTCFAINPNIKKTCISVTKTSLHNGMGCMVYLGLALILVFISVLLLCVHLEEGEGVLSVGDFFVPVLLLECISLAVAWFVNGDVPVNIIENEYYNLP